MRSHQVRSVVFIGLFVVAYYFLRIIPMGDLILYPFRILVTILHEFGHAAFALLTGGNVMSVQINPNGSGVTWTSGGMPFFIISGGYIGSAIFGNILLRAGLKYAEWSHYVLNVLLIIMIVIGTIWSPSLTNTLIVGVFAGSIYFIGKLHHEIASWFLIAMGVLSLIHIIEDFNVGPSSDLAQFTALVPILPYTVWMLVWLAAVVTITWKNVKSLVAHN